MKTFFAFLGVIILCALMPLAALGLDGMRYESYKQLTPAIATGGGDNDATVTLVNLPSPNAASAIKLVKSSLATDIPVLTAYDDSTKLATVGGLTASESRSITLTYNISSSIVESYPFFASFPSIGIVLLGIALLSVIIAVVVAAFSGKLG